MSGHLARYAIPVFYNKKSIIVQLNRLTLITEMKCNVIMLT